jgi:hypothetical protein
MRKWDWVVAQMVECLPSYRARTSNPRLKRERDREEERKRERENSGSMKYPIHLQMRSSLIST